MSFGLRVAPMWYWIIAVLLTLWGLMGCLMWYLQSYPSAQMLASLPDYDRNLMASLPPWFVWVYGAAVFASLFGALALLARRRVAEPLYLISLAAVVVQFGQVFAATDLIAVKGALATVPFPLFIVVVALGSVWLARHAKGRGWIR